LAPDALIAGDKADKNFPARMIPNMMPRLSILGLQTLSTQKKKNNHFVPRSYLKNFRSVSAKQIALYNLRSGLTVDAAPIKSQCSRDYFYTKNPVFEDNFGKLEARQEKLVANILTTQTVPAPGSPERQALLTGILFQAGRTATTAADADHLHTEFGKALLKHQFTADGRADLLEHLPNLKIEVADVVVDAVANYLLSTPLITDLDCTLFLNETDEDFLTSDHPIALRNGMGTNHQSDRATGLASRGLIILYPLSPRALLFLSDAEAYNVRKNAAGAVALSQRQDVIELNLAQCGSAYENLYFADPARVQATLAAFRKRSDAARPLRPLIEETSHFSGLKRRRILLSISRRSPSLLLPKPVKCRHAIKTGKYAVGDDNVRDPTRVQIVKAELDRLRKRRTEATERREAEKNR
jgi:hypothetical protein